MATTEIMLWGRLIKWEADIVTKNHAPDISWAQSLSQTAKNLISVEIAMVVCNCHAVRSCAMHEIRVPMQQLHMLLR